MRHSDGSALASLVDATATCEKLRAKQSSIGHLINWIHAPATERASLATYRLLSCLAFSSLSSSSSSLSLPPVDIFCATFARCSAHATSTHFFFVGGIDDCGDNDVDRRDFSFCSVADFVDCRWFVVSSCDCNFWINCNWNTCWCCNVNNVDCNKLNSLTTFSSAPFDNAIAANCAAAIRVFSTASSVSRSCSPPKTAFTSEALGVSFRSSFVLDASMKSDGKETERNWNCRNIIKWIKRELYSLRPAVSQFNSKWSMKIKKKENENENENAFRSSTVESSAVSRIVLFQSTNAFHRESCTFLFHVLLWWLWFMDLWKSEFYNLMMDWRRWRRRHHTNALNY